MTGCARTVAENQAKHSGLLLGVSPMKLVGSPMTHGYKSSPWELVLTEGHVASFRLRLMQNLGKRLLPIEARGIGVDLTGHGSMVLQGLQLFSQPTVPTNSNPITYNQSSIRLHLTYHSL